MLIAKRRAPLMAICPVKWMIFQPNIGKCKKRQQFIIIYHLNIHAKLTK